MEYFKKALRQIFPLCPQWLFPPTDDHVFSISSIIHTSLVRIMSMMILKKKNTSKGNMQGAIYGVSVHENLQMAVKLMRE